MVRPAPYTASEGPEWTHPFPTSHRTDRPAPRTPVRESGDLWVVVLDTQGNSIAQGSYSVPSFTGTAAATLRHMLAKFPPDSLEPGDVIATNDAWMGTGHLFDINVMRPVFRNGRIAGYTLSITHLPDIGGLGFGAAATEIYHEGLRLPICKLVRAGRLDEPMSTIYFSTGAFGALQGLDGAETTPGPSNMRTVPTEMWESLTGITILHKRLLPDTGGHGQARGGLGQEIEFRNDTGAPFTTFCVAPRSEFPARGLCRRRRRKPAHHPDRRPCGASEGCPHGGPGTALHRARRGRRGLRRAGEPAAGEGPGRCRGGARHPSRRARGLRRRSRL